jgi:hypothetical protein
MCVSVAVMYEEVAAATKRGAETETESGFNKSSEGRSMGSKSGWAQLILAWFTRAREGELPSFPIAQDVSLGGMAHEVAKRFLEEGSRARYWCGPKASTRDETDSVRVKVSKARM